MRKEFWANVTTSAPVSSRVPGEGEVVVGHVAPEVGGVVGVHRDSHARAQQVDDLLGLHVVGDEAVGDRAARQADACLAQLVDQRWVLDDVRAVVDAVRADVVHDRADVVDAADLIDVAVHRQSVAELAGAGEHVGELLGRVAALVGVEADAEDPVPERDGGLQRLCGALGAVVAEEAHDQVGIDPERRALRGGAVVAGHHGLERHAAGRVRLRVEEHLDVAHAVATARCR